jgi:tetratricopeptide (TPR) repeat protein
LWITDFGLAQMQSQAGLTMTGDLLGTLRYMSPEQALAQRVPIDHRTDIYSLGATLYELITLEPAFAGSDRQELLRQIAFEEPRPLRRLNKAIPVELETIALKALEKNPADRYATAQEVADDLERFLADKPIRAKRATSVQRARKWARRHQAVVWSAGVCLFMIAAVVAGSLGWITRDQAARREKAAEQGKEALKEADRFLREQKWPEALSFVGHAEAVLADCGDEELLGQAHRLRHDLETGQSLEEARLNKAPEKDRSFDWKARDAAYAEAFEKYRLDVDSLDPQEAADRIRGSAIRPQLTEALDDWALIRKRLKAMGWERRLVVARMADPNPGRNRLRDALEANDHKPLEEVVQSASPDTWPPATLALLGSLAQGTPVAEKAAALLRRAQQQHPSDFWINFRLASILYELAQADRFGDSKTSTDPRPGMEDAVHYFAIAAALRPQSADSHNNLANALQDWAPREEIAADYIAENIAESREAIRLNKDNAMAHYNLYRALMANGQSHEAVAEWDEAFRLKVDLKAHDGLIKGPGNIDLGNQRKPDEAIAECREAIRLKKDNAMTHCYLGNALVVKGRWDEAIPEYREAIRLEKDNAIFHNNLGVALQDSNRWAEAIPEYREAVRLKPDLVQAQKWLRMLLGSQRRRDEAIAEYREAIRLKKDDARFHHNLGDSLSAKRQRDEAIAEYREAIRINKDYLDSHTMLHYALEAKGQWREAFQEKLEMLRLWPEQRRGWPPEQRADLQNEVAWTLATSPDPSIRSAPRAVEAAKKAIALRPQDAALWNTLGVAHYRNGEWKAGIEAQEKSMALQKERQGGGPWQWFFLAMAHWHLGEKEKARKWFDESVQWIEKNQPDKYKDGAASYGGPGEPNKEELRRFRTEAEELLGINTKDLKDTKKKD